MKGQPNRLRVDTQHAFHGSAIDRTKPLKFRLDGRTIFGFEGDTVLSAVLASGVDTVGTFDGQPLGLGARFAPAITMGRGKASQALPMQRTPAIDGADFHLFGGGPSRFQLPTFGAGRRSLRLTLDRSPIASPWLDQPPQALVSTDIVVVGGGIAGMSAALAAARTGASVTLLESTSLLGGSARYFGSQEGDDSPDQTVTRLLAEIAAAEMITILLNTQVLAAHSGRVRAHRVVVDGRSVTGEVVDFAAPRIILATGAIERLPMFPGNRLPRVMSTMEAYLFAERYGVWLGQSAVLATVHSAAYRLPILLIDAGIATVRIADARTDPQSRFIEYSRAYGIMQAGSTVPALAEPAAKGAGLAITTHLAFEVYAAPTEFPSQADLLLVCGGWQPDLTLWHMAGGRSRWSNEHHRIEPVGSLAQIALAGSAAGYSSKQACLLSGQDAVDLVFGDPRLPVAELSIDPIYETPDGPTPTVPRAEQTQQIAYLDAGLNLIQPPDPTVKAKRGWWPFRRSEPSWSLADQPRALGIADVAAGVQLGGIPPESAGIVAQERTVASGDLVDAARLALLPDLHPIAAPRVPAYLAGRFGPNPQIWIVAPAEPRSLEVGGLIFVNSDQTDSRDAIGAIVAREAGNAIALIGKASPQAGEGLTLRDQGRPLAIRLVQPAITP